LGGKADTSKLTDEEMALFKDMVNSITICKANALEGTPPPPKQDVSVCALVAEESRKVEEQIYPEIQGEAPKPPPAVPAAKKEEAVNSLIMVRILEDLPPFAGGDRTYRLRKDDVANMPAAIGCALVKTGKAVELQGLQRA
jgi:DNA replication initiation complex subunit (GINS family)